MMLIKKIRDIFKRSKDANRSSFESSGEMEPRTGPSYSEPGFDFLDGMSTATARFIIDREVGLDQLENYDIKDVANKGRYYLAKIVDQDGKVTNTVLVDKLSRSIHFQKGTNK
jgi:hypothetical protein